MNQLVELSSIDEYEIMGALSELSLVDPLSVTRLLMKRVERQAELQWIDYDALPYHWDPPLRVKETTKLARCLAEVRDWMTRCGHDLLRYQLQDDGAELYQFVTGDWNDQALATLSDLGDAPTEAALVTAARLLAHAPAAVLFVHVPVVTSLLHRAESLGKESAERVLQALLTVKGVVAVWRGDKSEEDEQELEQAHRIMGDLPRGSIERRFFELLAQRIEVRTSWAMDRPHSQYDGREW